MKILFLIYHGFSDASGISKKIQNQINGLRQIGHKVDVCQYTVLENGHRVRMINEEIIQDYGLGRFAAIKKRLDYSGIKDYLKSHIYDIVYVRSFHNANPFTINLFETIKKNGSKIAYEIPTYPYDKEYRGFPFRNIVGLEIDKLFRKKLVSFSDAVVTFSDHKTIFGKRTISISNGIYFESIPLHSRVKSSDNIINLLGVAEVHYWHGYDRVIAGIGEYYRKGCSKEIYFHIVGGVASSEMIGSKHSKGFSEIISEYGIQDKVIFHGQLYGKKLDDIFNNADFCIGSLGRHRSGVYNMKSIKNREYAARGIPFIYSEIDTDFDDKDFTIKAPADDGPISIDIIINFLDNYKGNPYDIRESIKHLSWKDQMDIVIQNL